MDKFILDTHQLSFLPKTLVAFKFPYPLAQNSLSPFNPHPPEEALVRQRPQQQLLNNRAIIYVANR